MTVWTLKWIAVLTMLIDHVGALLLPQVVGLRLIGRISFPIFAFLTAEGVAHTRSPRRYLLRLLGFAVLSELPFRFALGISTADFGLRNVLFTLLLGVLACELTARGRTAPAWLLGLIPVFGAAWLLRCDYGLFGVAAVLLFYVLRGQPWPLLLACFFTLTAGYCMLHSSLFELSAVAAVLPLAFYNGQKGAHSAKYFFYVFYPAHLAVLGLLAMLPF